MQSDTLTRLVQQSSSAIEQLNSADSAQLENLQNTLEQICQTIDTMVDAPVPWLDKAKGSSAEAVGTLQRMMSQEFDDTSQMVQTLSEAVQELSQLIEQEGVEEPTDQPSPEPDTSAATDPGFAIHEDDLELIVDFIGEASEHLETVEAGLLELEDKPGDNETLNKIFRAFHTIKGMAGFLNLTEIGSLAHAAENLLDLARQAQLLASQDVSQSAYDEAKLAKYLKKAIKENRMLYIYDETGKQVRWLQYTLERHNVKNYYFMKKGAKGFFKDMIL